MGGLVDRNQVREVLDYLGNHHVMTIATAAGGSGWAAAVFYVNRGFRLYFVSDPRSRHIREGLRNQLVGAAIHEEYRNWREIKGIQLEGKLKQVPLFQTRGVLQMYLEKFPFVHELLDPTEGVFRIAGRAIHARFYELVPMRVLYLDNMRSFGRPMEFDLKGEFIDPVEEEGQSP